MRRVVGLALAALGLLLAGTARAGTEAAIDTAARGAELFGQRCAACHDHPTGRIPPHYVLSHLTSDQVLETLTGGPMRQQAAGLSPEDLSQLAIFITYKNTGAWPRPDPRANLCKEAASVGETGSEGGSWGRDPENTRLQPDPGMGFANLGYRGEIALIKSAVGDHVPVRPLAPLGAGHHRGVGKECLGLGF